MHQHHYILQPYSGRNSRYECPECGKSDQFSKYIDNDNGEVLGNNVGRCNRVDKCGYHYTPRQYFDNNGIKSEGVEVYIPKPQPPSRSVSYIDAETFNNSLQGYKKNNLVNFLHSKFDAQKVNHLINIYKIGASARYNGGTTVFWQIDASDNVRTGKLIKYDKTGHRLKGCNNWVHSVLNIDNFNLKQCFFGEHLLKETPGQTIGIVESEKTAIIASVYFPELVWLASGGAEGINKEKVKPLRGREVILFPDASKDGRIFNKWKVKANEFGFQISDYLEQNTTDEQKAQGVDIADFLSREEKPPQPDEVEQEQPVDYIRATKQIPYNTPSPVAVIDSKIENPLIFDGIELVVKNRVFTSSNGDEIEQVGIRDYGRCGNWKKHKEAKRYCKPCLLNCLHTLRINGKLQSQEYTQLELLIMQKN